MKYVFTVFVHSVGTLAGGTNMGNVALWKYSPPLGQKKVDGEQKWKLQTPATVEGPVRQVIVCIHFIDDWVFVYI